MSNQNLIEVKLLDIMKKSFKLLENSNNNEHFLKGDGTIVTKTDQMINDLLIKEISLLDSNTLIISEESPFKTSDFLKDRYWLIDPIDGTKSYSEGGSEYTINIALIENGYPTLGMIGHPPSKKIWYGYKSKAYIVENTNVKLLKFEHTGGTELKVITSRSVDNKTYSFLKKFNALHHVKESSSIKFCRLVEGNIDFYPRFQPINKWDIAAGDAIVRAYGGRVVTLKGNNFLYNSNTNKTTGFIAFSDTKLWRNLSELV